MFTFKVEGDTRVLQQFKKGISAESFEKAKREAMEEIMLYLFTQFVLKSPVRTGTYKRSWDCKQVSSDLVLIFSSDNAGKCWALEFGHSQQAPKGVCRVTWIEGQTEIKKIINKHMGK